MDVSVITVLEVCGLADVRRWLLSFARLLLHFCSRYTSEWHESSEPENDRML